MLLVLKGKERGDNKEYFERLFRLRRQVFIKGRGWSLPLPVNGLEMDQYDDEDAYYVIDFAENGDIQGAVRLTPTVKSSLLADYFPHLIENGVSPRASDIYEATRYMVLPAQKTRQSNRLTKARLLGGMLEWCLAKGLSYVQTVIDSGTLSSFVEITQRTIPLGLSHPFGGGKGVPGGGECLAIRWPVTSEVLHDIREYGAVPVSTGRGISPLLGLQNSPPWRAW